MGFRGGSEVVVECRVILLCTYESISAPKDTRHSFKRAHLRLAIERDRVELLLIEPDTTEELENGGLGVGL